MKKDKKNSGATPALRAQAEALAAERGMSSVETAPLQSMEDFQRTLHELRVHEIELSIQNEELRQSQKELTEARARYFDLYTRAPVGYCTVNEIGLILEANLTFAAMVGVKCSELVMRPFHLYVQRADKVLEHDYRKVIFATHELQSLEFRMTREDGVEWWAHSEGIAVQDADGADVCRLTVSDITRRVHAVAAQANLQAQLSQSQRFESLGKLAGGVAHNFNNMLSVILGHVEVAVGKVDPEQPLATHLREILRAAEHSSSLVRQLLSFASEQALSPITLNLNATIDAIILFLQELIGENIRLQWQPGPDLWTVKGDPAQVEQILVNLCMNARDAIADTGRIVIETGNTEFTDVQCASNPGATHGEHVWIKVSDTGRGMDPQTLSHIFEPFFTTKDFGKGGGMGLASVYGSVRQSGGYIVAASEPGSGSSFTIYLPRHIDTVPQASLTSPADTVRHGNETILLIEDENPVLNVLVLMLRRLGYAVLATSSASDALRLATENAGEVHLLLTDVIMPEINGKDLAAHLQSRFQRLRLLFMSGYPINVVAPHGVLDPGMHFIQKPFSMADLGVKIREVLDETL